MSTLRFGLMAATFAISLSSAFAVDLAQEITFNRACEEGKQITISAVGDLLLHSPLQKKAARYKDFKVLWNDFIPYFEDADVSYANLEGPTAEGVNIYGKDVPDPGHVFDNVVYTSYPQFNYHPTLVEDLLDSGIDIVSTSNNHTLDRRSLGADRTIDALDDFRMPFTGSRKRNETESDRDWFTVTNHGGVSITWIACTYGTNGIPDTYNQVLHCFKKSHKSKLLSIIAEQKKKTDAVIVLPHWGQEYKTYPDSTQVSNAKQYLEAGATAVIGNHPHVLQPMEKYKTSDGRETFIVYSLGNFVSYQGQMERRATVVLFLGLTKNSKGTLVNGVRFLPAYMDNRNGSSNLQLRLASAGSYGLNHIRKVYNRKHELSKNEQVVTNPQCN